MLDQMKGERDRSPNKSLLLQSSILLCLTMMGTVPSHGATVSGLGGHSCDAFMRRVEDQNEAAIDGYVSWAQGFISGYNWTNNANKDIKIGHGGLIIWVIDYCGTNPDKKYYEAIQIFVERHSKVP